MSSERMCQLHVLFIWETLLLTSWLEELMQTPTIHTKVLGILVNK